MFKSEKKNLSEAFNAVSFRPATAGDLALIADIAFNAFGSDANPRKALESLIQKSLQSPRTSIIIAFQKEADDQEIPLGYVIGSFFLYSKEFWPKAPNDEVATVLSLAVKKEFREKKLGRKLLDQVANNLKKAGAKKIVLQVETTNKIAINLYETAGFTKELFLKNYYAPGRHGYHMVRNKP